MRFKTFFLPLFLLLAGGGMGYGFAVLAPGWPKAERTTHEGTEGGQDAAQSPGERKVLYWYDPMYPGTKFDKPGKSPFMDMGLVPRYAEDDTGTGIRIDPGQTQNLAVRTEKAQRGRLVFSHEIPANVEFNAYQFAKAQPRADGFVETTYALAVGDTVTEGQPLVDITVPAWAADQSEYLLLRGQKAAPDIIRGVRERLRLSGMPEDLLKAVDSTGRVQTRLTVHAPLSGVITSIDAYPGMNVDKAMTLATIQGINPIWVTADVPERDIFLVGDKRIRVTIPAYPDRAFHAQSVTLLPKADQATRTVPLRLSLDNREGLLRPGLTASIRLRSDGEEELLIPTQSLIDLGEEQRVIIRAADGSFAPRQVQVLRSAREKTAVLSGLDEGDDVVVSGLFLIDSEANLRGALDRMRRAKETDVAPSAHGDHDHSAKEAE
ncbi:MAG: efflux RND transporter periplasmic adaptor subunit [Desulfovibrio sp.]|jgi:Cu(I)/Ag(I) efflux system membrane fusion protein|nr:efflux RND transporter periplasmic adaptor subunit [Desulfovibrio sp.]